MKTKVFILIVMSAMLVTTAFATNFPSMSVVNVHEKKAVLSLNTGGAKNLEITVSNYEGAVLYYKKTQNTKSELKKVFDFSEMADGNYKMLVCFDDNIISRDLLVNKNQLKVGKEVITHKPVFQYADGLLTVSCLNPTGKKVSLQIYRNGNYFFRHAMGDDLTLHQTFDLSELRNGNYKFVVNDNIGLYEYDLQYGY